MSEKYADEKLNEILIKIEELKKKLLEIENRLGE